MFADMFRRTRIHIRSMIRRRDLPAVLEIERRSFEFPWDEAFFMRVTRHDEVFSLVAVVGDSDRVVGFMIYQPNRDCLCVLNLAVHPEFRHRGIGRQMIENFAGELIREQYRRIFLEVRETNLPAQLFFRSAGFRAVAVVPGFYEDSGEDAYLFLRRVQPVASEALMPVNRISRFIE